MVCSNIRVRKKGICEMATIKQCPVWSSVKDKKEGKMYGILLESVQFYVIKDVGETVWHKILEHAGMKNLVFSTHNTYSDDLMVKLAASCCHVTKRKDFNQWMTFFGTCFVEFCSHYGYDNLLQVSGRYYRDFLHGIDNIHEIIRFSYPRLRSPSFLVLFEDKEGCILLYQSNRIGFKHYVKGQLSQIAKKFYKVTVDITIIEEDITDNVCSVKFRLDFDNSVYLSKTTPAKISGNHTFSSISGDTFLKVFPFCVIFNNQLIIKNVGHSMAAFLKGDNLVGCHLREKFHIRRPLIPCIWNRILRFQRVIFELEYLQEDHDLSDLEEGDGSNLKKDTLQSDNQKCLLRGEMKYIEDWDMVAFLCTPLLNNLKDLQTAGLYINDLNMFDMSRDMVMAGWQHASQLERSLEQQRDKSEKISENMSEIEEWKKKSDSLLYSMIPESIAERLKSGMNPIDTCQVFDIVTIMFVYMVGFADICTSSSPMEIVKCINNLFVEFDQIVDQYDVFKVETLGDAVYMVAGGVPDRNPNHAINVATVALKLQELAKTVIRQMGKDNLNTRIGMHSGGVVGGVVGRRMPQYCLFGDTVNTASRMQTYSLPGRIHVSEPCKDCLKGSKFITVKRGKVNVKGKGEMQTYWLVGEEGDERNTQVLKDLAETVPAVTKNSSYENALDLYGMHASTSYAQIELKPGCRRISDSQKLSILSSQLTLSPLHEHHQPEDSNTHDNLRVDTGVNQIHLGLTTETNMDVTDPIEIKIGEVPVCVESKTELNTTEQHCSFYLDNADAISVSSNDTVESEIGAVGGIDVPKRETDRTTLTSEKYVTIETEINSEIVLTDEVKEKIRKQKNYAKFKEIRRRLSLEDKRKSIPRENFSILGPFTFGNYGTESELSEDPHRNPQYKPQGLNRANTDSYLCNGYNGDRSKSLPYIRYDIDKVLAYNKERSLSDQSSSYTSGCPFPSVIKSSQYLNNWMNPNSPNSNEAETESICDIVHEDIDLLKLPGMTPNDELDTESNLDIKVPSESNNQSNAKTYVNESLNTQSNCESNASANDELDVIPMFKEKEARNLLINSCDIDRLRCESLSSDYTSNEIPTPTLQEQLLQAPGKMSDKPRKQSWIPTKEPIDTEIHQCYGLQSSLNGETNELNGNFTNDSESSLKAKNTSMPKVKSDKILSTKSIGFIFTNGVLSSNEESESENTSASMCNGISNGRGVHFTLCNGHTNDITETKIDSSETS